jgi:hypothetical protein
MFEDRNIFTPRLNRELKNFTAQLERTASLTAAVRRD